MQPSAYIVRDDSYDGTFAMCSRSVAFDVNGEIIPDYLTVSPISNIHR